MRSPAGKIAIETSLTLSDYLSFTHASGLRRQNAVMCEGERLVLNDEQGTFVKLSTRSSTVLALALLAFAASSTGFWQPSEQERLSTVSTQSSPGSKPDRAPFNGMAHVPPNIRNVALKQVAQELTLQGDLLRAGTRNHQPNQFSEANLEKLQPAILRQRTALLTPRPMDQVAPESTIEPSNEIVGSIAPAKSTTHQTGPLDRFQAALDALKSGKRNSPVTILHVGEGEAANPDFAHQLRLELQKRFGDAGRGMIRPAIGFQLDDPDQIELQSLGAWRRKSAGHSPAGKFGLSGASATSRSSHSSMSLTSKTEPFDWVEVTVMTGPSQGQFTIEVNDQETLFDAHSKKRGSRAFRLVANSHKAIIRPGGGARTSVLNLSSGRKVPGIRLVNFDMTNPEQLDALLLGNDIRNLDPELIIYSSIETPFPASKAYPHARARQIADHVGLFMEFAMNAELVLVSSPARPSQGSTSTCKPAAEVISASMPSGLRALAAVQGAAYWNWPGPSDIACSQDSRGGEAEQLINGLSSISASAFANWLTRPSTSNHLVMLNETRF